MLKQRNFSTHLADQVQPNPERWWLVDPGAAARPIASDRRPGQGRLLRRLVRAWEIGVAVAISHAPKRIGVRHATQTGHSACNATPYPTLSKAGTIGVRADLGRGAGPTRGAAKRP